MKFAAGIFVLTCLALVAAAQPMNSPRPSPLWPEGAPGALGTAPEDVPTLTAFLPKPEARNGASMLVLPGGGYSHLAEHEGKGYAEWLAENGVTAYVLQYRLGPKYHHPAMLNDAARALRTIRAWANRDGLDPKRVGVIGSSAGGHLAATLLTRFDDGKPDAADPIERESSRPDLGVLCYAVISMTKFAHNGSVVSLLGKSPSDAMRQEMSAELHVTSKTPPCFIWATDADGTVPVENSLMFAEALRQRRRTFFVTHLRAREPRIGPGPPGQASAPRGQDSCSIGSANGSS